MTTRVHVERDGAASPPDGVRRQIAAARPAVPAHDEATVATASTAALEAGKQRPAVHAAIEAVISASRLPIDQGLAEFAENSPAFEKIQVKTG